MAVPSLPRAQSTLVDANGWTTREWYAFFQQLLQFANDSGLLDPGVIAEIRARLDALEAAEDGQIVGPVSVLVLGALANGGVTVKLRNDVVSPGNTYYYGTGPTGQKGWSTVASAFSATAAQITLTVGADGVTTIGLADVADAGGGTLQRTAFDGKGRKTGTSAATTDHLTEGASNLYHTAARVLATALSGLSLVTGTAVVAADSILVAIGKLQKQITDNAAAAAGLVIDSIADADTTHAPSRNAVFDALALKQDADTTLSALAAQNWAANAVPIGSGADTVAQVAFAANTFPARASAGNLVAKPITDFGLSLVDDADASAGRSTLGLGTAATQNTGTSGANVPLLNGNNTYSGTSSLTGQVSIIRAAATAQHLDPVLDGTGNAFKSFSDPTNAKEYIFDATTDSGNTAPSGGAVGVRFSVLGVSRWKIDDTGALFPNADDTYTVGKSTNRPSIVYTKDLDTQETVINGGILSPAQITANQDNYAPTGHSATHTFRLNTDAARSITGLAGGVKGRQIIIANIGGFNITLSHDVTSTAANRFLCPGSAAVVIRPNGWVMCFYDDTSARWRVMGI